MSYFTPSATATYTVTGSQAGCTGTDAITIVVSSNPNIGTVVTPQGSCDSPDGEASATADGLTLGYTFQWWDGNTTAESPDFTGAVYSNISAGDYTVRATNNSTQCTSTALVSVSDQTISPQITGSATDSNTSCDPIDGEITVTALTPGVVGDYSFAWYMGNNTDPGNLIAGQSGPLPSPSLPQENTPWWPLTPQPDVAPLLC